MDERRAVLISENRLFREGIRQILENWRISVVGEGRDIPELLESVGGEVHPEVVIFHLRPYVSDALPQELMHRLSERFASAKLVVLADPSARHLLPSFVAAGASAILLTEVSSETLERSLDLVFSDHRLFPADVMSSMTGGGTSPDAPDFSHRDQTGPTGCGNAARSGPARWAQRGTAIPLSRREREVMRCLAVGLPNKVIARELNITEGTVKVHVKGLLRKTRTRNRTQLAIWALEQSDQVRPEENDGPDPGAQEAI